MKFLLSLLFKLPPFSLISLALRYKRKLPGLLWVGALGFLAWRKFGSQITDRFQEATNAYPPPAAGPWSGPTGGTSDATPTMAVAADLAPANSAPVIPDPAEEPEVAPDPAPVTTTG
jgi:hypothetical protein